MKPVLLVIDLRNWFFRTDERKVGIPKVVLGTNELIDYFDSKNWPVIHILTVHKADKTTWPIKMLNENTAVLIEGTEEAKELTEIKYDPNHQVLIKTRHSAFIRTDLENILNKKGLDTIVIAGIFLHGCVAMTAMDGYERDFEVIISKDATFSHQPELAGSLMKIVQDEYDGKFIGNKQIFDQLT